MGKRYLFYVLIIAMVWGCGKKDSITLPTKPTGPKTDTAAILSAKLEAKSNPGKLNADVACTIDDANSQITAVLPDISSVKKLALTFTTKTSGTIVKVADTILVSGATVTNFSKAVKISLQTPLGNTRDYSVLVKVFTGIPIINITTSSAVTSKDDYVTGTITVNGNMEYPDQPQATMKIKGHGNSSWTLFPKKPYHFKLDSKASMLGMPAAKDWILLANYNDKTLMRNRIALELARRIGSDYASESRYAEVYMNGEFLGNYLVTAQAEVNAKRVNITEMSPTSTDITGGYLLELDYRLDEPFWFRTAKNLPFTIKSPDDITPAQLDYIHNYIQQTEDAIFSANWGDPNTGYAKYINADSFVNWLLANEVVKNQDARDFSSIYYFKDKGGKLGMGPAWDFDLSSGNIDSTIAKDPQNWYVRDATWFLRLAQDPTFILKTRKRWSDIRAKEVQQIFTDIDQTAAYLELSQKKNFEKWPILDKYIWRNAVVTGSYSGEVAYMRNWLQQRVAWIDGNMQYF